MVGADARAGGPRIHALNARQIESVLRRNNVARIAFQADRRTEIFPVHYVYADGVMYGRTSFGTKVLGWVARPEVVAEVDEIDGLFDWRSVILRGSIAILRVRGRHAEPFAYWKAVAALRTLMPTAFREGDPTPARSLLFRITPEELTGRVAVMRFKRPSVSAEDL